MAQKKLSNSTLVAGLCVLPSGVALSTLLGGPVLGLLVLVALVLVALAALVL